MRDIGGFPMSELAIPPIRPDEAKLAEIALCPQHGSELTHLNREGAVMFCPIGGQYWRASKQRGGMYSRLAFAKGL